MTKLILEFELDTENNATLQTIYSGDQMAQVRALDNAIVKFVEYNYPLTAVRSHITPPVTNEIR